MKRVKMFYSDFSEIKFLRDNGMRNIFFHSKVNPRQLLTAMTQKKNFGVTNNMEPKKNSAKGKKIAQQVNRRNG